MTALVAAVFFLIAYVHGAFGVDARSTIAIIVWWTIALGVATGLWPTARLVSTTLLAFVLLAAFSVWTLISAAWSSWPEGAFDDFARDGLYVGVFVLVALVASLSQLGRWTDGIMLAATATALVGLVSRLLPGVIHPERVYRLLPGDRTRLSQPVGYWNGLAVLTSVALILLIRTSVTARTAFRRASAMGATPALAAVFYLTSSRTGTFAVIAGLIVFFSLSQRRVEVLASMLVATLGSLAAIEIVADRNALVNGPLDSASAHGEGQSAALWIALICAAVAVVYFAADVLLRARLAPGPRVQRLALLVGLAAVVIGVVASHPLARFDSFRRLPAEALARQTSPGDLRTHFFSVSGNGRWQLWTAAYRQFRTDPLIGRGSASFRFWWQRHRPFPLYVKDAHSLYLQTLGELGLIGLLLVLGFVATGLVVGVRRTVSTAGRETLAALTASLAAFALAIGFDWVWQLPVIAIAGVTLTALITRSSDSARVQGQLSEQPSWRRWLPRIALVVIASAVIAIEAIPLLVNLKLESSRRAVRSGEPSKAISAALDARSIEPWASTPYVQLALVQEDLGNLEAANAWIRGAIARSRQDWLLWIIRARIEAEAGSVAAARHSLAEARRLNPLEAPARATP